MSVNLGGTSDTVPLVNMNSSKQTWISVNSKGSSKRSNDDYVEVDSNGTHPTRAQVNSYDRTQ